MTARVEHRVLLLGGSRYNVESIVSAKREGFYTIVADRDPNAPGLGAADHALPIDVCATDALLEAIDALSENGIDGVVAMSEVSVRPAAELATRLGLPSISEQAAARATSKAAMRRSWSQLGSYSTDFEIVQTEDEARCAVTRLGSFPLILKPDRGSGSRGVSRLERPDDLATAFCFVKSAALGTGEIVIERCVEGTECSAEVLIWKGKTRVLCIGQNVKSGYPYRVNTRLEYPLLISPQQHEIVADMCHQAIAAVGLTEGLAHIEFAYTEQGPILFELGARCGGGHIPQIAAHVSGIDEFIEACRMACGMAPQGLAPSIQHGAVSQFLIFPPGRVAQIEIPEAVRTHAGILDVAITVEEGDTITALRDNTGRAGFVVALASTLDSAVSLARWACDRITIRYEDGTVSHPLMPQ